MKIYNQIKKLSVNIKPNQSQEFKQLTIARKIYADKSN